MKMFDWEQREAQYLYENQAKERRQRLFLAREVLRIARTINESDPVAAAQLMDAIEDSEAV